MSDNGNGKHPSDNGGNGRDLKGRFTVGNPGGNGNPHACKTAKFRSLFIQAATTERVEELIENLWLAALTGKQQWAILEILNRLYGKPKETIKVESDEDRGDPFPMLRDKGVTDALAAFRRRAYGSEVVGPGSGGS